MNDIALMGPILRSRLLTLAGEVLLAGPVPEDVVSKIDEIGEALDLVKRTNAIALSPGDPQFKTRHRWLYEHYAALARTRAHIELFRPLDDQRARPF